MEAVFRPEVSGFFLVNSDHFLAKANHFLVNYNHLFVNFRGKRPESHRKQFRQEYCFHFPSFFQSFPSGFCDFSASFRRNSLVSRGRHHRSGYIKSPFFISLLPFTAVYGSFVLTWGEQKKISCFRQDSNPVRVTHAFNRSAISKVIFLLSLSRVVHNLSNLDLLCKRE